MKTIIFITSFLISLNLFSQTNNLNLYSLNSHDDVKPSDNNYIFHKKAENNLTIDTFLIGEWYGSMKWQNSKLTIPQGMMHQ